MTISKHQMQNRLDAIDQMVLLLEASVQSDLQDIGLMRFSICMSEALTNLVQHSTTSEKKAPIDIWISKHSDKIDIEIFDPIGAPYFNPLANVTSLEDVDAMSENGRGLGILVESCDTIEYGPVDSNNRLKLSFSRTNDI